MTNTATFDYQVMVNCPKCNMHIDLLEDNDDESRISMYIFNNEWEKIKGLTVICNHCEHEFDLDGMEY